MNQARELPAETGEVKCDEKRKTSFFTTTTTMALTAVDF
jgi:hypothetical protein